MIIKRIAHVFEAQGVKGLLSAVFRRLYTPRARCFPACREIVSRANGIEIGGPSPLFAPGGLLPVYSLAERIDNCNFAPHTIFYNSNLMSRTDGNEVIEGDKSFVFKSGKSPGRQFIAEGGDLHMIPNESYAFVLSSHMLEHTSNPLRALEEWQRILQPGGGLILVLPHRDGTFDHRRPVTTLEHLILDFERQVREDDLTHISEVLQLHDLSLDFGITDAAAFRERIERNTEMRSLHHHVFDTRLAVAVVSKAGFELVTVEPLRPYHIIVVARKSKQQPLTPRISEDTLDRLLRRSPFSTDRH